MKESNNQQEFEDHTMSQAPRKRLSPTAAAARLTRAFILMTVLTTREASEKSDVSITTAQRYVANFMKEGLIVRMSELETSPARIYKWVGVE